MGDAAVPALAVVGSLTASFLFLSPVPAVYQIYRTGDTRGMSPLPFFLMSANTFAWVVYGLLVPDQVVFWLNAVFTVPSSFYCLIVFSHDPSRIKMLPFVAVVFYGILVTFGIYKMALKREVNVVVAGSLASAVVVCMYASPIQNIVTAVKNRSVEPIPLPIGFASFLNGTTWTFFGLLTAQPFVAWPNFVGAVLGVVQILAFGCVRAQECLWTVASGIDLEKQSVNVVKLQTTTGKE